MKSWTLMYIGAVACALLSVVMVSVITSTGNVSYEIFIYFLIFFGFAFAAGGYVLESRYKKEHPEEFMPSIPEEE